MSLTHLTRQHGLLSKATAPEQNHVTGGFPLGEDHNITRYKLAGADGSHPAALHSGHYPLLMHQLQQGVVLLPQVHQECCVGGNAGKGDDQGKYPVPCDAQVNNLDILHTAHNAIWSAA